MTLEEELVKLRDLLREAQDAIIWMSGSADFGPDGQASEGWEKTKPIIWKIDALLERKKRQ